MDSSIVTGGKSVRHCEKNLHAGPKSAWNVSTNRTRTGARNPAKGTKTRKS